MDKIIACELAYLKCFSRIFENDAHIIRFRDEQLPDMYDHNVSILKHQLNTFDFSKLIEKEITISLKEQRDFCNIKYYFAQEIPVMMKYHPEIICYGIYKFQSNASTLKTVEKALIKQVTTKSMLDEVLEVDLATEDEDSRDFCIRRWRRRGVVYVTNPNLSSFICYYEGQAVGRCDLFMDHGIAKIEDFAVMPSEQRKGYGTTMIKSLIDYAIEYACHTFYLVTDESDTAKEMYKKIGFKKIGECTSLFFKFH